MMNNQATDSIINMYNYLCIMRHGKSNKSLMTDLYVIENNANLKQT